MPIGTLVFGHATYTSALVQLIMAQKPVYINDMIWSDVVIFQVSMLQLAFTDSEKFLNNVQSKILTV